VLTSELRLMGYPSARPASCSPPSWPAVGKFSSKLAEELRAAPPVLVGIAEPNPSQGRPLYNSAVLLHKAQSARAVRKCLLPTYDVFDEDRYFESGSAPEILALDTLKLGVTICEDVWNNSDFWRHRR